MFDTEELLAVAFRRERMLSRRLAKGASLTEHDALVRTLEKAADGQTLRELVDARRAAQTKAADALRRRAESRAARPGRARPADLRDDAVAWTGWFDGSAMPNPGRIGIGGVLKSPRGEMIEISETAGRGDSSAAEYLALIALLDVALKEGVRGLTIYGDSRVVIDDMGARAGEGIRSLDHYASRARELVAAIGDVTLQWIPRERNARADALTRRAVTEPALAL
jgi:ribonuclease HI